MASVKSLRSLTLGPYSQTLRSFPGELFFYSRQETLLVTACSGLLRFPEDLGSSLLWLKKLELRDCTALLGLPESASGLTTLEVLEIRRCTAFEGLSEGVSNWKCLTRLEIERCDAVTGLPVGIAGATSLQELIIQECSR